MGKHVLLNIGVGKVVNFTFSWFVIRVTYESPVTVVHGRLDNLQSMDYGNLETFIKHFFIYLFNNVRLTSLTKCFYFRKLRDRCRSSRHCLRVTVTLPLDSLAVPKSE